MELDPRIFIHAPYITCPKGHVGAYGVLSIGDSSYTRRCRECWHTANYPLPKLRKKVIYIDQFAISNMMKALNDEMKSHEKVKTAEPFWLELFDALERVSKLQLVVCPDSSAHRDESLMAPYFDALKLMYEQLSHGLTFLDSRQIADYQVNMAALEWLNGKEPVHDRDIECVTTGSVNGWQGRLRISVEMKWSEDVVEGIREFRDSIHEKLADVLAYYQGGPKDFDHWFEHERQAGGNAIMKAAANYGQRLKDMFISGELDFVKLEQYRSSGSDTYHMLVEVLKREGDEPKDAAARVQEFVNSEAYKNTPANRLRALMWAAMAHQAANGRTKINKGMNNDINTVSALLPYCDAMLVDREFAGLLGSIPGRYPLGYETRILSLADRDGILEYLRSIEADADPAVIAAVKEVYGDDWLTPFRTMYKVQRERTKDH